MKIDCEEYSKNILEFIKNEIEEKRLSPKIAVIMVGKNNASEIYVRNKVKTASKIGIEVEVYRLDELVEKEEIFDKIHKLNNDNNIDGIIVQLPLPYRLQGIKDVILNKIDPKKDLDGLNTWNIGLLHASQKLPYSISDFLNKKKHYIFPENFSRCYPGTTMPYIPCTALGCLFVLNKVLMDERRENLIGKNVVILGNSNLVSKPIARLLLQSGASTTTLHSRSRNYDYIIKNADIIISATGKEQKHIKCENIKKDAILIDIGIRQDSKGITGDLDFEELSKTHLITPVPKGIGPMTIASLMFNSFLSSFFRKINKMVI